MPIYTGRGDEGKTDLHSGERVGKESRRIEVIGTVDELNAVVGIIRSRLDGELGTMLGEVQNQLHICQTDLANTGEEDHPRVDKKHVDWLEDRIDGMQEDLPELDGFVLQGGAPAAAHAYHARAVCRRAERRAVQLADVAEVNPAVLTYLNRLSDFLFTVARTVNHQAGVDEDGPTY